MVQGVNRGALVRALIASGLPKKWKASILREGQRHYVDGDAMRYDNDWLAAQVAGLARAARHPVSVGATADEVREIARRGAESVLQARGAEWSDEGEARAIVRRHGLDWPGIERATCVRWWRRKLNADLNERTENLARELGHVGGAGPAYVSDETHARWLAMKRNSRAMIEAADVLCLGVQTEGGGFMGGGELISLADAVDASVSNPKLRHSELMARAKGLEVIARERGDVGLFWTHTLPTSFHPMRANNQRNGRWSGATPRDGADNILAKLDTVRKALDEAGIRWYGLRVMEPHRSGTPHQHMLVFVPVAVAIDVQRIVWQTFTRDVENIVPLSEDYLRSVMVKCELIDDEKGGAAAYLAKYVSKNVVDIDGVSEKGKEASRAQAWASAHRIRQFQFIGGPGVTTWRECRRMTPEQAGQDLTLFAAHGCVHRDDGDKRADFAEFVRVQGGIMCGRRERPIQLDWIEDTAPNMYGEIGRKRLRGLVAQTARVETRAYRWAVRWGAKAATAGAVSRTRFNNCRSGSRSGLSGGSLPGNYCDTEKIRDYLVAASAIEKKNELIGESVGRVRKRGDDAAILAGNGIAGLA